MNLLARILLFPLLLAAPACRSAGPASVAAEAGATVARQLDKARANHRLALETKARIGRDLELLRRSPAPDPALVKDYEAYLERVSRMEETCASIVREMETVAGPAAAAPLTRDPGAGLDATAGPAATLPNRDELDALAALDRELNQALSEFDRILLQENAAVGAKMEEVAQANAGKLQELAQQAAEAAGRIKDRQAGEAGKASEGAEAGETADAGAQPGEPGAETGAKPGEEGQTADKPGEKGTGMKPGDKPGGEKGGTEAEGAEVGGTPAAAPAGTQGGDKKVTRPGAEDDDIVARQLREAAEAEKDPVLKEKLWKEYDDYKKSTRR